MSETYTNNVTGKQHRKEAVSLRACVGMWPWRAFAFTGACPIGEDYCFELATGEHPRQFNCLYFCEVETIDNLVSIECDHPEAESDYG